MIPPFLRVLIRQPELIATHLQNYADLLQQEMRGAASNLLRAAIAWIVFALALALFVVFAGLALMLGVLQGQFHWVLLAIPGAMLVVAAVAMHLARRPVVGANVAEVRQQFAQDLHAWNNGQDAERQP